MADKYSKRIDGPTPNGGSYSIAYFRTESGMRTTEDKSKITEIVEFDNNNEVIMRSYLYAKELLNA